MKRLFLIISFIIVVTGIAVAQESKAFDLKDFLSNPFQSSESFPEIFESYADMELFFKKTGFKIVKKEEVQNSYDKEKIDTKMQLHKNNVELYYYCLSEGGKCLLDLMTIKLDRKNMLRYDFHKGMKQNEVTAICGNRYYKNEFEKNYELCYGDSLTPVQVNFSFSNKTHKLNSINFWYGVD